MFKSLIQTDAEGIVRNTVLDVEQYNYSTGSFPFPNDPVVIDNDLAVLPFIRTRKEDNTTVLDTVFIHPYTEQILTGTINGGFQLNEQIVQTPVTVEVTNDLVLNGATATEYSPTVGTIGASGEYLGKRAAQFKGTYLDLVSGKGAGLRLPPINTDYRYFMVEGFLYFEAEPTNYDPILITRSSGVVSGTTQDSFSVEYDHAYNQLVLKYTPNGLTLNGFDSTLNMSPADGVTANQWHHFAFSVDYQGITTYVATFFNGTRIDSAELVGGVTWGNVRNSTAPICIGCGLSAERPLKGWLDSVLISGGANVDALRGYGPTGSSIIVPVQEPQAGDYTIYSLTMNGPLATSLFPCDTSTRVVSTASYISNSENKVGVGLVSRQQSQFNGITLFNGVCFGHALTGVCAGPCFGVDSGTYMTVTGVEQLHGITVARRIRSNAAEFTIAYLLGSTGMQGRSGASGDFPIFFTRNWGGNTFSYLATQTNTTELKFIYDTVTVSGRTGIFYVKDFGSGKVYGVQTADIKNLYADVVEYHSVSSKIGISASSRILGITGMEDLYNAKGFEDEAIAQKVAPNISNVGILYINNNARLTKKTTNPERAFQEYTIEGIIK
jgi:hypothetical protein